MPPGQTKLNPKGFSVPQRGHNSPIHCPASTDQPLTTNRPRPAGTDGPPIEVMNHPHNKIAALYAMGLLTDEDTEKMMTAAFSRFAAHLRTILESEGKT